MSAATGTRAASADPLVLGVLVSGSGTNLQAIIDEIEAGRLNARIAVVISDRGQAYGLERAKRHGIDAVFIDPERFSGSGAQGFNKAVLGELASRKVELVVLAGYMRLLGASVLDRFPDRVVNLHPALLPSFAGAHGIKDAFEYGVKVTGVTVHFANEVFDEGPIIAQEPVRITEGDTVESLEAKIHEVEHRLYPRVIKQIAEGKVSVCEGRVRISE
ncbi:MAG: phosphoribosylglycinamide formyltransferase [Coriobacteriia bacterium]|nr:phosphoribosylglycinamide formyltransferase [Coriobacteriia bacterium]